MTPENLLPDKKEYVWYLLVKTGAPFVMTRRCGGRQKGCRVRSRKALEAVVGSIVVVPVLAALALKPNSKFDPLSYRQCVGIQQEGKLVGKSVTGVGHVDPLHVREGLPRVQRVPHVYRLVEI